MSNNLKAGEFYGEIRQKREVAALTMSEIVHRQKRNCPAHSHEQASFNLLLNGSYAEKFGKKSFSFNPMTVWWHPAEIFHQDEVGIHDGHFFTIEIEANNVEKLSRISKTPEMFFETNTQLVWQACRLYHEFRNWQICSELVTEGIFLEMLAHSFRQQTKEKQPPVWLLRVIEKLNDQFTENLTTEELAAEANVHPVHLAAVFRQFYHETISEYIQKLRVSQASKMLRNQEIPLSEIAYTTGFSEQSHFTRIFKRHLGITPAVFRQTLST
jgi:AraC family transcriptional regulator